jgi:hypothetical protein
MDLALICIVESKVRSPGSFTWLQEAFDHFKLVYSHDKLPSFLL